MRNSKKTSTVLAGSTGKGVSLHFKEDEIPLLEQFTQYRKRHYITLSGWVKQQMSKTLSAENQSNLSFRRYETTTTWGCPLWNVEGSGKKKTNETWGVCRDTYSGVFQWSKEKIIWV